MNTIKPSFETSPGQRKARRTGSCSLPSCPALHPGSGLPLIFLLASSLMAFAQDYSIPWQTIGGGGGTSTGGVYSISGTIGSPDAGPPMTGGDYSMQGGFWSLIAIQTEGAPKLTIVATGPDQATISWSPNTPGFVLQERLNLLLGEWMPSPSTTNNPTTVTIPQGIKFYRLVEP